MLIGMSEFCMFLNVSIPTRLIASLLVLLTLGLGSVGDDRLGDLRAAVTGPGEDALPLNRIVGRPATRSEASSSRQPADLLSGEQRRPASVA